MITTIGYKCGIDEHDKCKAKGCTCKCHLSKPIPQEPAESQGSDMKCRCGKPIWGEGYDPKTRQHFYSHVDDNMGKHSDGTWVEPAEPESGK